MIKLQIKFRRDGKYGCPVCYIWIPYQYWSVACHRASELCSSVQLHTFVDASNYGYGCVSYLCLINQASQTHCSFEFGNERVSPLKDRTIPYIELAAAVLPVRIKVQLQKT